MSSQLPPEWEEALAAVAEFGGTAMMIGAPDTGKTTFCSQLLSRAALTGRKIAVVDADIGQSEIGPPACVSFGVATRQVESVAEIEPVRSVFVGSTSPRGRMLEHVAATYAEVRAARATEPHLVIVDTTGMVEGPAAHRLKRAKIEMIRPDHLIAIQRKEECKAILAGAEMLPGTKVWRLPVPAFVKRRSASVRAQRRQNRFARYFAESEIWRRPFDGSVFTDTWLNGGEPLAPQYLRFMAGALGVTVYYAEKSNRHLGVVVGQGNASETGIATIHEQFRPESITLTPASRLRGLLLGLSEGDGLLGLGLLESVDFRRRELLIRTPIRSAASARLVQFGILRLRPDGTEFGTVRPGEI